MANINIIDSMSPLDLSSARESNRYVHRQLNSMRVPQKNLGVARDTAALDRCRIFKLKSLDRSRTKDNWTGQFDCSTTQQTNRKSSPFQNSIQ